MARSETGQSERETGQSERETGQGEKDNKETRLLAAAGSLSLLSISV
jgi:hypothetical protein